jgi:hypothetical protein
MQFPSTRLTLVQRLAFGGTRDDWDAFFDEYWEPLCRFALRRGARDRTSAEDVAAQVLEILWHNDLLARWVQKPWF